MPIGPPCIRDVVSEALHQRPQTRALDRGAPGASKPHAPKDSLCAVPVHASLSAGPKNVPEPNPRVESDQRPGASDLGESCGHVHPSNGHLGVPNGPNATRVPLQTSPPRSRLHLASPKSGPFCGGGGAYLDTEGGPQKKRSKDRIEAPAARGGSKSEFRATEWPSKGAP
ncbi:hypothetical protein M885DRAFT_55339 [Pelagophyceae sp. CCMP2097]|nr:hypothetical protein M885DRAFT_55339 [Pelagophyceae sp. CCMP2097]